MHWLEKIFRKPRWSRRKRLWKRQKNTDKWLGNSREKIDSTYARRIAEKLERDEFERRKRTEILDQEVAKKMQAYEVIRNANANIDHRVSLNSSTCIVPDVNRVGLPLVENVNFKTVGRHQTNVAITHNLRNLRLNDDNENYEPQMENMEPCSSEYVGSIRSNRTPTPATLLPEDLNEIITDVDLQEEANRRLQEEKDAELARMLQKQEEEIFNEEIDRDRLMAIEAQDKELAKLLYEKEKAKIRRAKERARQRALQKKQAQSIESVNVVSTDENSTATCTTANSTDEMTPSNSSEQRLNVGDSHSADEIEEYKTNGNEHFQSVSLCGSRTSVPVINVAMHIDPTYLSQQSSSMPNSLIFQDGDNTAPPYMPIQGQRRNPSLEKKPKKSKCKDGCKQQ